MITAFEYETPIRDAIKAMYIKEIDEYEDGGGGFPFAGASDKILFADYELAYDEAIAATGHYDGVVMSYFNSSNYPDGLNTATTNTQGNNTLNVVVFGFGDTSTENTFGENSSTKVATDRAKQLAIISYKAIMNRTEIHKSFNDFRIENIDEEKNIKEKNLTSCEKTDVIGATQANRSIASYEYSYNFKLVDIEPTEPLGLDYDGSDGGVISNNP